MRVFIRAFSTCLLSIFYVPGKTALLMGGRPQTLLSQCCRVAGGDNVPRGEGERVLGSMGAAVILYGEAGKGFLIKWRLAELCSALCGCRDGSIPIEGIVRAKAPGQVCAW